MDGKAKWPVRTDGGFRPDAEPPNPDAPSETPETPSRGRSDGSESKRGFPEGACATVLGMDDTETQLTEGKKKEALRLLRKLLHLCGENSRMGEQVRALIGEICA